MIQTTIGTRRKDSKDAAVTAANKVASDLMQRWMEAHGMGVYTPQRIDGEADNVSVEYDPATKGLRWKASTIAHLAGLSVPPSLMHFGGYYCGAYGATTWKTVRFPDPAEPSQMITQDELTLEQLTGYLRNVNDWLHTNRIVGAMVMDEPAHKSSDPADPGKYGWTPDTEKRNIKWAFACIGAGFELRVAMPGISQLRYWLPKLPPQTRWVLHEATDPEVYRTLLPVGTEVWIYNVRAVTLPKLAQRLEGFRNAGLLVKGVLMWNAVPWTNGNDMPLLFDLSGAVPVPTDAMWQFLYQLGKFDETLPVPAPEPETWQEGYAMLNARLKAGGL